MPFLCEGVTDRIQPTQWFNLLTNLLSKHVCFTIIPALVFYTMRDYNKQSATESSAKTSFRGTGTLQIKDFYFQFSRFAIKRLLENTLTGPKPQNAPPLLCSMCVDIVLQCINLGKRHKHTLRTT